MALPFFLSDLEINIRYRSKIAKAICKNAVIAHSPDDPESTHFIHDEYWLKLTSMVASSSRSASVRCQPIDAALVSCSLASKPAPPLSNRKRVSRPYSAVAPPKTVRPPTTVSATEMSFKASSGTVKISSERITKSASLPLSIDPVTASENE